MNTKGIVTLPYEYFQSCAEFAVRSMITSAEYYMKSQLRNPPKIMNDILIGKMAEWGLHEYLRSLNKYPSTPDMSVFSKEKKSYKYDMECDGFNIHIKSSSYKGEKWQYSWVIQKNDPVIKYPKKNDLYAFCIVHGLEVTIVDIIKCSDAKYEEMAIEKHRSNKVSIVL